MSRTGTGVFVINSAGQPVASGQTISSTVFNTLTADLATGLTTSICTDGQTTTTGLIPFAFGLSTDILSPYTPSGPVSVSGGQLTFPAVQNPSSNVNTLDDYEEGTFTPTDASGAALSFSVAKGEYVKIGRVVWISLLVTYPSTADTSSAVIGSLPFTADATQSVNMQGLYVTFTDSARADDFNINRSTTTVLVVSPATGLGVQNVSYSLKTIGLSGTYKASA